MDTNEIIDLARAFGYRSEAAAIIFVVLYTHLFIFFLHRSFLHPACVHFMMTFFCTIRITAFVLRTVLISVVSVGEKLGPLKADQILVGVGYYGLLYSAYTLVLDIEIMRNLPESSHPLIRLSRDRNLYRFTLFTAVILVISSTASIKSDGTVSHSAKAQHDVGIFMFLGLTALQALQTILLARMETSQVKRVNEPFGSRHAMSILLLTSVLLLVREVFSAITVNNAAKQNMEHFWYPLVAVPEILVSSLFLIPGLVPRGEDLKQRYPQQLQPSPQA